MKTLVTKDTRRGKGPIKATKTVLAHRRTSGIYDRGYTVYQEVKGDSVSSRSLLIDTETVHAMGSPDVVTITIEPGDTLN